MGIQNSSSFNVREKLIASSVDNTAIICDYSRATQEFCKPLDVCVGGCIFCTCGPLLACAAICQSSASIPSSVPGDCFQQFGNAGNSVGHMISRGFSRSLGAILGVRQFDRMQR